MMTENHMVLPAYEAKEPEVDYYYYREERICWYCDQEITGFVRIEMIQGPCHASCRDDFEQDVGEAYRMNAAFDRNELLDGLGVYLFLVFIMLVGCLL